MTSITVNKLSNHTLTNLTNNLNLAKQKLKFKKNEQLSNYLNAKNNPLGVIYIVEGQIVLSNSQHNYFGNKNEVIHYLVDESIDIKVLEDTTLYIIYNNYKLLTYIKESKPTLINIANIIHNNNDYTFKHGQRVAYYANIIDFFYNKSCSHNLILAAIFHDIGKVNIPNDIVNKAAKLTHEEYQIMQKHPFESYQILKKEFNEEVALIAYHHHETLDGQGYPLKLTADKLSIEDRILAIADVFDALTSDRCYCKAIPFKQAFEIMKTKNKNQLDQKLILVLEKALNNK